MNELKLVLSPRLIKHLENINHYISDALLSANNSDTLSKKTYIDIHPDNNSLLTYTQSNKVVELLSDGNDNCTPDEFYIKYMKHWNLDNYDCKIYNSHRSTVRLGRFINDLFGVGTFPTCEAFDLTKKQNDIDSFVRIFKSKCYKEKQYELFSIVNGDDVADWYKGDNYDTDGGSLGNSCMAYVDEEYFDIYTRNTNKLSMLILYTDSSRDTIRGRALIWNLDIPENRIFMDRIYTNDSSDEQLFLEYAKDNKWLHKVEQNYGEGIKIYDTVSKISRFITLKVNLGDFEYDNYPFLDTLQYYNMKENFIINKKINVTHLLDDTDGCACEIDEDDHETLYVYSKYHSSKLDKSMCTYCEFGKDWVLESDAIYVFNTNGKNAVPDNKLICLSSMDGLNDKHFLKSKCTYSTYLDTWVYNESVIKVYKNKDKSDFVLDSIKRRSKGYYVELNGEYYLNGVV